MEASKEYQGNASEFVALKMYSLTQSEQSKSNKCDKGSIIILLLQRGNLERAKELVSTKIAMYGNSHSNNTVIFQENQAHVHVKCGDIFKSLSGRCMTLDQCVSTALEIEYASLEPPVNNCQSWLRPHNDHFYIYFCEEASGRLF